MTFKKTIQAVGWEEQKQDEFLTDGYRVVVDFISVSACRFADQLTAWFAYVLSDETMDSNERD